LQLTHHSHVTLSQDTNYTMKPKTKLLIVEDEALFARAVMRRLQKVGYECEHVESVQDAKTS